MKKKKRRTQEDIILDLLDRACFFQKRQTIQDFLDLNLLSPDGYYKWIEEPHENFLKKYGLAEIFGRLRRKVSYITYPIPDWINEKFEFEK